MGRITLLVMLAAITASCAGYGGGSAPAGGGDPTPAAPTKPANSPLPSGNPDVDKYGY